MLEKNNYHVILQRGTKKATLGTVRFFDIYVPELNLLIECDGEYWHSSIDRINIDLQKHNAALGEGYKLLRISDSEISRKLNEQDESYIMSLLTLTSSELEKRSLNIIKGRLNRLCQL